MTVQETEHIPAFANLVDLASDRIGGTALAANDEFFASRDNLLKPGRGVFIPDKYTDRGKWMDGWETRRRRDEGHDWCVIRLGRPGVVRGVDIDTNNFVGNQPEHASIDAATGSHEATHDTLDWSEILQKVSIRAGCRNLFPIDGDRRWTHLRLNIYPDGGVARFRAFGYAVPALRHDSDEEMDVACVENGGVAILCSDQRFGQMNNMLMPGKAVNMGDGWETRRRRGPGFDWAIVRLGSKSIVERVEVDTNHFKGNYPGRCSVEACLATDATLEEFNASEWTWTEVVAEHSLAADTLHTFPVGRDQQGPFTHVRLNIFPDGGVARFRVFGRPVTN